MKRYNDNNQIITITTSSSQKAYYNFIDAIKSSETKQKYSYYLLKYIKDHLLLDKENLSDLLLQDSKKIEEDIISYIKVLRDQGLSYSTINTRLAALYLFFTMNDIVLNRKKINRYLGEHVKTIKDRAYTRTEIKQILENCDLKFKVVVSLMASSGCRIGAIPLIRLGNLSYHEKYQLHEFVMYERTNSESITFCSPECSKYILEYLDYRKRCGERLGSTSPLIRNDFVMDDQLRVQNPKPLTLGTLSVILRQILIKSGLRIVTPLVKDEETGLSNKKKMRKSVALNHGLRKWAHTTMTIAKMDIEVREMILSHSIGLSDSYYRPSREYMLQEYLKAIDDLTINDENRLKHENEKLKEEDEFKEFQIQQNLKQKQIELEKMQDQIKKLNEAQEEERKRREKGFPESLSQEEMKYLKHVIKMMGVKLGRDAYEYANKYIEYYFPDDGLIPDFKKLDELCDLEWNYYKKYIEPTLKKYPVD